METKRKRAQTPKIQEVTEEVGRVYKTNNCGDVVLLEYVNTKNITIQFLESGNMYKIIKDNLEKGLIKDSIKILRDADDRRTKLKEERLAQKLILSEKKLVIKKENIEKSKQRLLEKNLKAAASEKRKLEVIEKQRLDKASTYKELLGQKYSHTYFGEYEIVDFDLSKSPLAVKVKFAITGYETWANKGVVLRGSVYDKSREGEEDWKILMSLSRAKSYQENREVQLSKAKQWQKDNPDKCRVRNQNRRAKRFELGGEVSLEELDNLMIEQDYKCANCKDELTDENKHMDHIIPVVLKGTGDIGNIQWLCDYCNLSKNDKHPDLWAKVVATKEWWDIKALRQGRCVSKEC